MFVFPTETLQKLKCSICDGYLSSSPLMLTDDNREVCGKCFRLIPEEESAYYRHESGLEVVAELFTFPCRYNLQGCNKTFAFDSDDDHETKCPYKYNIQKPDLVMTNINIPSYTNLQQLQSEMTQSCSIDKINYDRMYTNNGQLEVLARCDVKENKCSSDSLHVKLEMQGYGNNRLHIGNSSSKLVNNNKISVEGVVLLKSPPKIVYLTASSEPLDNVCDPINSYGFLQDFCTVCNDFIRRDIFSCNYGHKLCENCHKGGKTCTACVRLNGEYMCPNYSKGCRVISTKPNLSKHVLDCEFNDFTCCISNCNFKGPLEKLKYHALESHSDKIIQSNQLEDVIGKTDRVWYLFCYDRLFKCVYNYFETHVEVLLVFVGPNDSAVEYQYEVIISPDNERRPCVNKKAKCLGWNVMSLESGVQIDMTQMREMLTKKVFRFEIVVHVLSKAC